MLDPGYLAARIPACRKRPPFQLPNYPGCSRGRRVWPRGSSSTRVGLELGREARVQRVWNMGSAPGNRVQRNFVASLVAKLAFSAYPLAGRRPRTGARIAVLRVSRASIRCWRIEKPGFSCQNGRKPGFSGFSGSWGARAHATRTSGRNAGHLRARPAHPYKPWIRSSAVERGVFSS